MVLHNAAHPLCAFLHNAGLLAGGTGLTPMIRLIHTILSNLEDRVKVRRLLQQWYMPELLPQL